MTSNECEQQQSPASGSDHKHQCPVCLDFSAKTVSTQCNHTFCVKCIFKWIFHCVDEYDHINCPLCRQNIRIRNFKWN